MCAGRNNYWAAAEIRLGCWRRWPKAVWRTGADAAGSGRTQSSWPFCWARIARPGPDATAAGLSQRPFFHLENGKRPIFVATLQLYSCTEHWHLSEPTHGFSVQLYSVSRGPPADYTHIIQRMHAISPIHAINRRPPVFTEPGPQTRPRLLSHFSIKGVILLGCLQLLWGGNQIRPLILETFLNHHNLRDDFVSSDHKHYML